MAKMRKQDLTDEQLESEDTWESQTAVAHPAVKSPRTVVSVSFPIDDFVLVEAGARRSHETVSHFIRQAAVDRAQALSTLMTATSGWGNWVVFRGVITDAPRVKQTPDLSPATA